MEEKTTEVTQETGVETKKKKENKTKVKKVKKREIILFHEKAIEIIDVAEEANNGNSN